MLENMFEEQPMSDTTELPPTPPTSEAGPVIDPSSTVAPSEPRPTAPVPPSTTSSSWRPDFAFPSAAPAGPGPVGTAPARARRAAAITRTRAIVGGTSVAAFLAILAAVGLHGRTQPASSLRTGDDGSGSSSTLDPGFVRPNLGGGRFGGSASDPFGSSYGDPFGGSPSASDGTDPFGGGVSGGGFSATPGSGSAIPHTRSHGS
jgi:hypothetical protein